jgi:Cof subfamily protein (haloacid dehalogenase superfamily)
MDGTLLRADGTVDPRDAAAITRAMNAGIAVTIATGRVSTGTLPTARSLGLQHPLVCGDGGIVVDAITGERIEQTAIALHTATDVVAAFDAHALVPFVVMHDAIHADARGQHYTEYVRVWTDRVHIHEHLAQTPAWKRDGEIALTVGIGSQDGVQNAHARLESAHAERLDLVSFKVSRMRDTWAILTRPFGCTKGTALARVAARLGVRHEDTCVVGDWFNDVPMFTWAKRSFAMGQAPDAVRRHATDSLGATAQTGGGVAEAIHRWLGV